MKACEIKWVNLRLTLVDNQARKPLLAKADVERRQPQSQSIMPDGLEKRLSEQEFIDLVAFLAEQIAPRR